jgi:hypothetical protein
VLITGVNDTGNKMFIGVNDIGDKIIAGVIVTGDNLLPVSLTRRLRLVPDFYRFYDNGDKLIYLIAKTFMRKLHNNKKALL